MALNQPPEAHALPCGHSIEDLWDRMQTGTLGLHERSCPHCLTATDGLAALADATRALRADTAGPPPDLLTRVMTAVQADVRRVRTLTVPAELGPVALSEQAIAVVLRYAVDAVDGVRARRCRLEQAPGRPGAVRVRISLTLRYGAGPAATLLDQVRRQVHAAARASVGLDIVAVDLDIEDVWPLDGPGSGRPAPGPSAETLPATAALPDRPEP